MLASITGHSANKCFQGDSSLRKKKKKCFKISNKDKPLLCSRCILNKQGHKSKSLAVYSADTETDKFLEEEHGKQIRKSDMDVVNLKHYQSTMVHTTCPFTKEEYSNSTNIRA